MDVSVIVPVHNGALELTRQLEALSRQSFAGSFEVVVVDNRSTDDTRKVAEALRDRFQTMKVVSESQSQGRSAAVNCGVRESKAERLLTCDHDDLVDSNWVQGLSDQLREEELVVGSIAFALDADLSSWDNSTFSLHPPVHAGFLPFAMGCSMGFTRGLFDRLGGFDSVMDGAEDIDFSWRANLCQGVEVGFASDARLLKGRRRSARGRLRQHRNYGRADARLAARFADYGYTGFRRRIAKQGLWVIGNSWRAMSPQLRVDWAGTLGRVLGAMSEDVDIKKHDRMALNEFSC